MDYAPSLTGNSVDKKFVRQANHHVQISLAYEHNLESRLKLFNGFLCLMVCVILYDRAPPYGLFCLGVCLGVGGAD